MGMFDTYDNLIEDYTPNNTSKLKLNKCDIVDGTLPKKVFNSRGKHVGYTWHKGEYFDFTLTTNTEISVRDDAIILEEKGLVPDVTTVGRYEGQRAYNIIDGKSWTYTGKKNNLYIWTLDDILSYPSDGDKNISINTDMTNKHLQVDIHSFRKELLYSIKNENDSPDITIKVNEEFSNKLSCGLYYATLKVCGKDTTYNKFRFIIVIS